MTPRLRLKKDYLKMTDHPRQPDSETPVPVDQLTYEQAFTELEAIVNALEWNEKSLEAALTLFERGQALIQHCSSLLNQAELKVQELTGSGLADFTPPA
jgi:exodeoxyribonuclease VII small subunit